MEVKILKQTTAMDWKLMAVLFMIRVSFAFISFKQRIIASIFISGVVKTGVEKRYSMSYLISETTREQREQIVAESLGNIEANCDGCMAGLAEMYQDYIDGKKELREINMEFNARYVKGDDMPGREGCPYM